MPRPKKDNAEYFSHDNNMRNDPKIKALRRKYGITGYAIFNMLLEVLTESEKFNVKIGKVHIELMAGDFDCEPDLLFDLIEYSVAIELLERDGENIFSSGLKKRLAPVVEKRELARKKEEERQRNLQQKREQSGVSVTETTHNPPVSVSETTQSKVKESKVININNIVARKRSFADSLTPFVEIYGKDTIRAFYDYWSESNKSGTKFKQELQKTWETSLRLANWAKNDFNKSKVLPLVKGATDQSQNANLFK